MRQGWHNDPRSTQQQQQAGATLKQAQCLHNGRNKVAYMNQELKAKLAPEVKNILKKYNLKGSISTSAHAIKVTIAEGDIDFGECCSVNEYRIEQDFRGVAAKVLTELKDALNGKGSTVRNHDNSDVMTDYFDVGWYIKISIGKWNKPYKLYNA
jgi:hypothetical protein